MVIWIGLKMRKRVRLSGVTQTGHLGPVCGAAHLRFWRESELLRLIFRIPCVFVENFEVIFDYFAFATISPSYGIYASFG